MERDLLLATEPLPVRLDIGQRNRGDASGRLGGRRDVDVVRGGSRQAPSLGDESRAQGRGTRQAERLHFKEGRGQGFFERQVYKRRKEAETGIINKWKINRRDWERGKPESSDHIGVRIEPGLFPSLVILAQSNFEHGQVQRCLGFGTKEKMEDQAKRMIHRTDKQVQKGPTNVFIPTLVKRLGGTISSTNSWAVAGDVAFRATGVASALLGLGTIPANVALRQRKKKKLVN